VDSGNNSSPSGNDGNLKVSSVDQNMQELAIAVQLLWSSVSKIRSKLGALAIQTKSGDIETQEGYIIFLPKDHWKFIDGQPVPNELVEDEKV